MAGAQSRSVIFEPPLSKTNLFCFRKLPSSLLLLSRAFTVTQPIKERRKTDLSTLAQTLSTLPDDAVEEVQLEVLADDTRVENEKKLEYLKREEERIREEESEMRTLQTEPVRSISLKKFPFPF